MRLPRSPPDLSRPGCARAGPIFIALWLWCILLALTTTATSFGAWISFRIPFGLAEAVTWPAASVLMSRWFPRIEYSQAMSLQNLGLVVGAAVAPPIVAFIIAFWGWKAAFIITGLIAGILGTFFYHLYQGRSRRRPACLAGGTGLDSPRSGPRGQFALAQGIHPHVAGPPVALGGRHGEFRAGLHQLHVSHLVSDLSHRQISHVAGTDGRHGDGALYLRH